MSNLDRARKYLSRMGSGAWIEREAPVLAALLDEILEEELHDCMRDAAYWCDLADVTKQQLKLESDHVHRLDARVDRLTSCLRQVISLAKSTGHEHHAYYRRAVRVLRSQTSNE